MIESVFAAFAACALLLFWFMPAPRAAAITCIAGWLLLPVGHFSPGPDGALFSYWIIGTVLPSDMLLNKLWVPPVIAIVGALSTDWKSFARARPQWLDLPMLLWCAWPLAQSAVIASTEPPAWTASLYLLAAWGAPWTLGRIYFSSREGANEFLSILVAGLIVILPLAVIETLTGPDIYDWFYEPHPFRSDGDVRYFGHRPIGFFEHGNQYGIWVAATAVAAIWLWRRNKETRGFWGTTAAVAVMLSLLSQSLGAIALMFAGSVALWVARQSFMRWTLPIVLALVVGCAGVYLAAAGPLRTMAETTGVGKKIVDVVRATGRGSVLWRFARDQKAAAIIKEHPIVGSGHWDWWRPNNERPWNLSFLIVGQFGLIGLMLAWGSLLIPVLDAVHSRWRSRISRRDTAVPLAVMVAMAIGDSQFNSFFFYPALVAAGALVPAARLPAAHQRSENDGG